MARCKDIDLSDPKAVHKLFKRATYVAKRRGYSELADDFAQEVALNRLSGRGRHQTIDQAFIDYLRSQYGRTGARGSGSGSGRVPKHINHVNIDKIRDLAEPTRDLAPPREFAHLFRGREAELYRAYFVEERANKSIGEELGITESRVSQLLSPIKERIRKHAILLDGYERMEWDDTFLSFRIEWAVI